MQLVALFNTVCENRDIRRSSTTRSLPSSFFPERSPQALLCSTVSVQYVNIKESSVKRAILRDGMTISFGAYFLHW